MNYFATVVFATICILTSSDLVRETGLAASRDGRGSKQVMSFPLPEMSAIIWQGFHFQWLRKVLGLLETPHRLGSVGSYIGNISNDCNTTGFGTVNCTVTGNYTVQFSPGVDGDYAFPRVYFSGILSNSKSNVYFLSGNWSFHFRDSSMLQPVPHADTTVHLNATIILQDSLKSSQSLEVFLQGFELEMLCVESPDHPCNSNAIWAYYLNLSMAESCQTGEQGKVITCPMLFAIGRGWTPSHGGGKPYNYQMAYNVTVYYTAVVYPKDSAQLNINRITGMSDIFQPPLSGRRKINNTAATIIGLKEFSWNLTGNYQSRGRYMEELAFSVQGLVSNEFQWEMGFMAPRVTTYPSNVEYSMAVSTLALTREYIQVSPSLSANGSICKNDEIVFHCSAHGLRQQLFDHVTVYSHP